MNRDVGLFALFAACLRLGLTAYGQDAVRRGLCRRFGWAVAEFAARSRYLEVIPGGTGAQYCAQAGHTLRGVPGAAVALAGYCLPGFGLLAATAALWPRLPGPGPAAGALSGLAAIAPAVCLVAGASALRGLPRAPILWALAGGCAALFFLGLKPFSMLLGGAVLGVLLLPDQPGLPAPPSSTPYRWRLPIGLFLAFAAATGGLFALDPGLGKLFLAVAKAETWGLGGFGAAPLLFADAVRLRHWMEAGSFSQVLALARAFPGPATALAGFVAFTAKGLAGAATAFAAACLASLFLFLAARPAARLIASSLWAAKAATGVRAVLGGLCLGLAGRFAADAAWNLPQAGLASAAALALALRVHPAVVTLAAAAAGALLPR